MSHRVPVPGSLTILHHTFPSPAPSKTPPTFLSYPTFFPERDQQRFKLGRRFPCSFRLQTKALGLGWGSPRFAERVGLPLGAESCPHHQAPGQSWTRQLFCV